MSQVIRQSLLAELEDSKQEAVASGKPLGILDLITALTTILKDGRIRKDDYEPVVSIVTEIFNGVIRPADGLPDVVDNAIEASLRPAIQFLFDKWVPA